MPQWKCEIKHVAYYESLRLIYLGEQITFIYCFVCVCPFMGFIFALFVHSFHSKTQSMVKGKWNIFLQFLMVDALSQ